MVSVLSFNRSIGEQKCIEASCRNEVALRSNDGLRFIPASTCAELQKVIKEGCMIDLIYYEIEDEPDIDWPEEDAGRRADGAARADYPSADFTGALSETADRADAAFTPSSSAGKTG